MKSPTPPKEPDTSNMVVRTVLGDVEPGTLGHTQPHEHLLIDLSKPLPGQATVTERSIDQAPIRLDNYYRTRREHPSEDLRLYSVDDAVEELRAYSRAGGSCVVDATSTGIGRDPAGLAAIARQSNVHIVMGSGVYYRDYHPHYVPKASEDALAQDIVSDIRFGVADTSVKSGVIGEIGLSYPIDAAEEKALSAACIAQLETEAALMIHPGRDSRSPAQAMEITSRYGVAPERIIMSHTERTLFSNQAIRELADSGCMVAFDLFGQESSYYPLASIDMPNDATRIDYIADLLDRGYGEQVLISQDICHKSNLIRYGGEGYSHILDHVLPLMRRKGIEENAINTFTVENPRRALAFPAEAG